MRNFVRMLSLVAAIAMLANSQAKAVTLAEWTYETATPADLNDSTTYGPFAADGGVFAASSFTTGVHAGSATDWSTPAGNGSANSMSSNTWAVGDYYQFQTSSTGYNGLTFAWDQTSSGTGPRDFILSYSTDNVTYSPIGSTYAVLVNGAPQTAWSSGTNQPVFHFSVGLASFPAVENAATLYFRITNNSTVSASGATVAAGGTDRVDNVTVTGALVPEPATIGLLALGGLLIRSRKQRA